MHHKPIDAGDEDHRTSPQEDIRVESAVLGFVLHEHPRQLTIPELSLAINRDPSDFSDHDAIERAIGELVGAGLLHCRCGLVMPSRAALCRERLELA